MKNEIKVIQVREYNTPELIGNETDALNEFAEYSGSTYLCDAMQEISDSYIPIYTYNLWKNAADIQEYIDRAIGEGLSEAANGIESMLVAGYYYYYNEVLYNNFENLKFNFVAEALNEYIKAHELELDIDELENKIESLVFDIDNNSNYDDLDDVIKNLIEVIEDYEA